MAELLTHGSANKLLNTWLLGAAFDRLTYFITGWELRFRGHKSGDILLSTAELTVPEIDEWRHAFSSMPMNLLDTNESDDVIVAAHLFSALNNSQIDQVSLTDSGDITLVFKNSVAIRVNGDVDLVDWTWELTNTATKQIITCDSGPLFLSNNNNASPYVTE